VPQPDLIHLEGKAQQDSKDLEPLPVASPAAGTREIWNEATWTSALGAVYVLAATLLLGRWLLGHLALCWLLRTARPAPRAVVRLFREMSQGQPRRPRLLVSKRLRVPLSCGLWRPTVLIPSGLCAPQAAQTLRWVFAHELTHLERRDVWVSLMFGLAQVVYFYLPWFWRLRRQVRLCQEYIADAAAVELAPGAEDYAQFLLSLIKAPAVPGGATGVSGDSSDLFRRVTMLLQTPMLVEKRCPRWWSLTAATALLALAVCLSGIGLRADATPLSASETVAADRVLVPPTPGKDQPQKPEPAPSVNVPLVNPGRLVSPDEQRELLQKMQALLPNDGLNLQKLSQLALAAPAVAPFPLMDTGGRLGVRVKEPSETLVEQLNLPKGQGMVIEGVESGSAAAKAGLKAHDVLLELNGKPVKSDAQELRALIHDIKANTPVEALVLRKGKREVIKGISLPEAKEPLNVVPVQPFLPGVQPPNFNLVPAMPALPNLNLDFGFPLQGAGHRGVLTTNFRSGDRFTTRHQEGSLIITVTGTVADGKAKVGKIQIQDGTESSKYESVDKVPEQYRDKVKNLIEANEKSHIKIEIKTPTEDKNPGAVK
jgi:beta-lactamase regulating signal transducer with metallopeptidase domain